MRGKLKVSLVVCVVVVLSAALLAPIAGASGQIANAGPGTMMGGGTGGATGGSWCGGGLWNGSGPWGGTGMWGMGSGMAWLKDNPAALQAWLQMRAEHVKTMQAWYDTYRTDLTSPAAQQALHVLWITFWNDMKSFYEQYGSGADWTSPMDGMWNGWQMGSMMGGGTWDPGHMWGSGYGSAWMTSHTNGMGQWLAMRGRQVGAMNAWWQHHRAAQGSGPAQAALKTLSGRQRAQVRRFYQQHHLSTSPTMMRAGAGGWMGLGGMWGGFGW
jgi:hypothetical protein